MFEIKIVNQKISNFSLENEFVIGHVFDLGPLVVGRLLVRPDLCPCHVFRDQLVAHRVENHEQDGLQVGAHVTDFLKLAVQDLQDKAEGMLDFRLYHDCLRK